MRSMSELEISTIAEEGVNKFIEIHFIGRNIIITGHNLVGDTPLFMDDVVENRVDGTATDEVIAVDVILLAYAVGTVLTLTAVGVCPWKFYKGHVRGCREGQTDTGSFDGADYQLSLAGLKGIDSSLFLGCVVVTCNPDSIGELLLQSLDNLLQRAEHNQRLAVGEEILYKVGSLFYLTFGGERAQGHELYQSLHAHLAAYLPICTLGVFAEVGGEVSGSEVVFITVGDFNVEVCALLVGQLCKHLCLLTAYHAGVIELIRQFREVLILAVLSEELATATEVRKQTAHDGELRNEVLSMVDNRGAGQEYAPLLTLDNATGEHGLLCGWVLEPV